MPINIIRYFVYNRQKREIITNLIKNWTDANNIKMQKNLEVKHFSFDVGTACYQNGKLNHTDPGNLSAPKLLTKGF